AKNYHPAFKELCEGKIFLDNIINKLNKSNILIDKTKTVFVNPKSLSKAVGQNKCNLKELNSFGYNIKFKTDKSLDKYEIKIN
ncbi:MAG: radical SAM protein, partial [Ruminococcus sp.]|nr:radical SAM protein [Ruminococcus sp.]